MDEVALGGTVASGLVLAGVFAAHVFTDRGQSTAEAGFDDRSTYAQLLAVRADWYLDPRLGWHVQAAVGAGWGDVDDPQNAPHDGHDGSGYFPSMSWLMGSAGAGYELFFANQWSFGALAQVTYLSGSGSQLRTGGSDEARGGAEGALRGQVKSRPMVPSALVTLTFH